MLLKLEGNFIDSKKYSNEFVLVKLLSIKLIGAVICSPAETFGNKRLCKFNRVYKHWFFSSEPNLSRVKFIDIFDFKFEDFEILNYDPHPHIKGKVAV